MKLRLAVFLLAGSFCSAQEFGRYELSGGFSYGGVDNSNVRSAQGWAGSFATNLSHWFALETNAGGQYQMQSVPVTGGLANVNTGFFSLLGGPRIAYRRGRVTPFSHGLFGVGRSLNYSKISYDLTRSTFTIPYENALSGAVGGGIDYEISRRVALRTQGDYFLTQPDGTIGFQSQNNFRLVAAIVFNFGSRPGMSARMTKPQLPRVPSRPRDEAIAKETPVNPAPAPATTTASTLPPAQPVPNGRIESAKPTAAPVSRPEAVATVTAPNSATTIASPAPASQSQIQPANRAEPVAKAVIRDSAVVAKQTSVPAPVPAAVVAPRQDPFTAPVRPTNPAVSNSPSPGATVATTVVRAAAPAGTATPTAVRPPAAPQPAQEQFSLGEYARKLREKKESKPSKDWD